MFTYTDNIYRYKRIDAQIQAEFYDKRNTFECCIVSVVDKDTALSWKIIFFVLSAKVHIHYESN